MRRNIRTLFDFEPPATEAEIRAASPRFVRKLSGFHGPGQTNQAAFDARSTASRLRRANCPCARDERAAAWPARSRQRGWQARRRKGARTDMARWQAGSYPVRVLLEELQAAVHADVV